MSLIFAAAFSDCAVVAGDGLRRVAASDERLDNIDKTYEVSPGILAAKMGYGGVTDAIWGEVEAQPANVRNNIDALLAFVSRTSRPMYEYCLAHALAEGHGDYGLMFIFASWDARGAGVHWIDHRSGMEPTSCWRRQSDSPLVVASGPDGCQQIASTTLLQGFQRAPSGRVAVDTWVTETVTQMSTTHPVEVGFPATMRRCCQGGAESRALLSFSPEVGRLTAAY
jgi:hypothetical protein